MNHYSSIEGDLRAELDRAKRYLDVAGVIMIALDSVGRITLVNQKGCEVLELSENDILGKNWFENFLPEEERKSVVEVFEQLMAGELEHVEFYENIIVNGSGAHRLIAWHNGLLKSSDGSIEGVICSGEDVTESRRVEKALQESRRRHREIYEGSRDGYVFFDLQGQIIDANKAYCEMLGYSFDELREFKNFSEFTPKRWHKWEKEEIWQKRLLDSGYSGLYEKEYIRKNGEIFPVEIQAYAVLRENGAQRYVWGVTREISERKRAEEATAAFFDESQLMLFIADLRQNKLLRVNNEVLRNTGRSEEELLSKVFYEFLHPDDHESTKDVLAQLADGKVVKGFQNRSITADGKLRNLEWNVFPDVKRELAYAMAEDITQRMLAEQALDESEEILKETGRIAKIGGWKHDLRTGKATWTKALFDIVESEGEPPPGVTEHLKYYPPEDAAVLDEAYRKAVEQGVPFDLELECFSALGRRFWCRVIGTPALVDGECVEIRGTFQDIHEQKLAQLKLVENEKRYRAVVEDSPGVMCSYLPNTTLTFVNDACCSYFGTSAQELIGKRFIDLLPEGPKKQVFEMLQAITAENPVYTLEHEVVQSDGSVLWQRWTNRGIFDESGRPVIYQSFGTDITELKAVEQRNAESLRLLRDLVESIPNPVFYKNLDGVYLGCNQACRDFLGVRADNFVGKTVYDVVSKEVADTYSRLDHELLSTGGTQMYEDVIKHADGFDRNVIVNKAPFHAADGSVAGLVGMMIDISDRKRSEEELLKNQKRLRKLAVQINSAEERERKRVAAGLHDNVAQNLALCMLKTGQLAKSWPSEISAKHLNELREVLSGMIHEVRSLIFEISPPLLYEVGLEAALKELVGKFEKDYRFSCRVESKTEAPIKDKDKEVFLYQAGRELLINVGKHAQASKVDVILDCDDESIELAVSDNGQGFKERTDKTSRAEDISFGLFFLKERATYLGGALDICSKLGEGARVTLKLPISS